MKTLEEYLKQAEKTPDVGRKAHIIRAAFDDFKTRVMDAESFGNVCWQLISAIPSPSELEEERQRQEAARKRRKMIAKEYEWACKSRLYSRTFAPGEFRWEYEDPAHRSETKYEGSAITVYSPDPRLLDASVERLSSHESWAADLRRKDGTLICIVPVIAVREERWVRQDGPDSPREWYNELSVAGITPPPLTEELEAIDYYNPC